MTPRFPIEDDAICTTIVQALDQRAAEIMRALDQSAPPVVKQALRDLGMRPVDRLAMHYLADVLTFNEFREMKSLALASLMGIEEQTAGRALRTLVARGYLEEHRKRKPRAFRMPWSRRTTTERAA